MTENERIEKAVKIALGTPVGLFLLVSGLAFVLWGGSFHFEGIAPGLVFGVPGAVLLLNVYEKFRSLR
ncbi:MAG: hypothetical protein SV760_05245 [Halobacteria archaeon]|nr:hypothetical protein [Halobacteria archaeon]